jgi:glycosyltransferase involved in cell wall biosynthesis
VVYLQEVLEAMKTCVVIPTYNEEKEIGSLVLGIRDQGLSVVVVDDGSTDNTVRIAEKAGAVVLRNPRNHGKGASLIKGFDYALAQGFAAVVTMDGDGQHLVRDLPVFLNAAEHSGSGVFIGNRMHSPKNMPAHRLITNAIMSLFVSGLVRQKIPDTQCGFRLIKSNVLKQLGLRTSNYEIETEILLKAAALGLRIESVPISTVYAGEKSRINPFIDTLRFFRYIIREIWTTKR